jgi:hypothetical protein
MLWRVEQLHRRPLLDDDTVIHKDDTIGDLALIPAVRVTTRLTSKA